MRNARLLEAGVVLATALSAAMLGILLAAPLLPEPAAEPAAEPSLLGVSPVPSPSPETILPPLGLYRARQPISTGPCIAIELEPRSYPVGSGGGHGIATVHWWIRGRTGCDTRSSDVQQVDAQVTEVRTEGDQADALTGYSLTFSLPHTDGADEADGAALEVEIAILPPRENEPSLLQALEVSQPGSAGLVLDRVGELDPPLGALPGG